MTYSELESMLPWERDIYIELIRQHIEAENKKIRESNNARKTGLP
jgi:hypothetical protein